MKKNRLYILLFVFVMFFCVNVGGVKASYGITCYYATEDCYYTVTDHQSSHRVEVPCTGAKDNGRKNQKCYKDVKDTIDTYYAVSYGINYWCPSNSSCDAWGRGYLKKIKEDSSSSSRTVGEEINASGYNSFIKNIKNNKKSLFGVSTDGPTKCPSSITINDLSVGVSIGSGAGKIEAESGKKNNGSSRTCTLSLKDKYSYKKGGMTSENFIENVENLSKSLDNEATEFHIVKPGNSGSEYGDVEKGNKGSKNHDLVSSIINWAMGRKDLQKDADIGIDESDELECSQVLGDAFADVLAGIFTLTCVIGVVLLIFTLIFDFIKAITSGEDGALLDAFKKAKIRVIATIILLLLPVFVNFIIDFINNNLIIEDGDIKIGNVSECNVVKD